MSFTLEFSLNQWIDRPQQSFFLTLNHNELEPAFRHHPGSLGLLDWRLGPVTLSPLPDFLSNHLTGVELGFDPEFTPSIHAQPNPRELTMRLVTRYDKTLADLRLDRHDLSVRAPLQVLAHSSKRVVYQDDLEIYLRRPEGTHVLALDFGTSSCCVALARREERAEPTLLRLQDEQAPYEFFPSPMWLFSSDEARPGMQEISLAEKRFFLGLGHRQLNTGLFRDPQGILPSIKRIVDAPPELWMAKGLMSQGAGLSTDTSPAATLLQAYLAHLLRGLYLQNLNLWRQENILIEEVVVTVPNTIGFQYVERIRSAVALEINRCGNKRKGGLLIDDWRIPEEKVTLMREADAVAVDYVVRAKGERGLMSSGFRRDHTMLVVDVGAGTTDSSLVRCKFRSKRGSIQPELVINARRGIALGGDTLDRIIAEFLIHQLSQSKVLRMSAEDKLLYFGKPNLADEHIADELYNIGFFEPFQVLANRLGHRKGADQQLDHLQSLRMRLREHARLIKEHIGSAYYAYEPTSTHGHLRLDGVAPGQSLALLGAIYDLFDCGDQEPKQANLKERYRAQVATVLGGRVVMELSLRPFLIPKPWTFSVRDLYHFPSLKQTLEQLEQATIVELLDTLKHFPPNQHLHVLLTGRVLAFPLLRERLIWKCANHHHVRRLVFPNQDFEPRRLKEAVVRGALGSRIWGLSGTDIDDVVQHCFYLLHYDEHGVQRQASPMITAGESFAEDGQLVGQLQGIHLRPLAEAVETLCIVKLEAKKPGVALAWTDHPLEAQLMIKATVDRVGDFAMVNERTVTLNLNRDGSMRVRVYPERASQGEEGPALGHPQEFKPKGSSSLQLWNHFPM